MTYTGGNISGQGRVYEADFHLGDSYGYSLSTGQHSFFSKAYRQKLILPNKIVVSSQADDSPSYSGEATDAASYALLRRSITGCPFSLQCPG